MQALETPLQRFPHLDMWIVGLPLQLSGRSHLSFAFKQITRMLRRMTPDFSNPAQIDASLRQGIVPSMVYRSARFTSGPTGGRSSQSVDVLRPAWQTAAMVARTVGLPHESGRLPIAFSDRSRGKHNHALACITVGAHWTAIAARTTHRPIPVWLALSWPARCAGHVLDFFSVRTR